MKESMLPKPSISPATTIITPQQAKKFVYFSTQTQGTSGRPVKIDPLLLPHFLCLVDPASHQGLAAIRHIEGLRAKGGLGDSFQNANRAFDFMDHVGNISIHYKIMQVDAGAPAGVYITDIRPGFTGDNKSAGLYKATKVGNRATVMQSSSSVVASSKAFINGRASDLIDAGAQALETAKEASISLFYNPAHAINDMGCWFKPSKQEQHARTAAEKLAKVLNDTEAKGAGKVLWHIRGEGAQLLSKALEKISSDLTKHRFQFFSPIGDMNRLIGNIKRKKGELAESLVTYDDSRGALVSLLTQRGAISATIRSLVPQGHPYSQPREKLVAKILSDSARPSGAYETAKNTARGGINSFVDLLRQAQGIATQGKPR